MMKRPLVMLTVLVPGVLAACSTSSSPPVVLTAQAAPTLQFAQACKDISKNARNTLTISGFTADRSVTLWTAARGSVTNTGSKSLKKGGGSVSYAFPAGPNEFTVIARGDQTGSVASTYAGVLNNGSCTIAPPQPQAVQVSPAASTPNQYNISASIHDEATGNSPISAAQYQLDGGSWVDLRASGTAGTFMTLPTSGSVTSGTSVDVVGTLTGLSVGTHRICVRGVDATGQTSSGTTCTTVNQPPPAPTVTELSPNSGPDTGGTVVTLTGTHLTDVSEVRFGSVPGTSVQVISDTRLSVVAPAGTGTAGVTVVTPGGESAALPFTYTPAAGIKRFRIDVATSATRNASMDGHFWQDFFAPSLGSYIGSQSFEHRVVGEVQAFQATCYLEVESGGGIVGPPECTGSAGVDWSDQYTADSSVYNEFRTLNVHDNQHSSYAATGLPVSASAGADPAGGLSISLLNDSTIMYPQYLDRSYTCADGPATGDGCEGISIGNSQSDIANYVRSMYVRLIGSQSLYNLDTYVAEPGTSENCSYYIPADEDQSTDTSHSVAKRTATCVITINRQATVTLVGMR